MVEVNIDVVVIVVSEIGGFVVTVVVVEPVGT